MIKIGILPIMEITEIDNPYSDIYKFSNLVSKRIFEVGAIPVGILLNDGKLDLNSLKMCDAFVIGGGKKIEPFLLETINYAIHNNVPLLGICLGMQSIGVYSYLEDLLKGKGDSLTVDNFLKKFYELKEEDYNFLQPVENHYKEKVTRSNYAKDIHPVAIAKDSKLYDIYNNDNIDVVSLHKYAVYVYGNDFKVNCMFENTIEGIERIDSNSFILGTQWHPELEEKNNILFKALVNEAQKRK